MTVSPVPQNLRGRGAGHLMMVEREQVSLEKMDKHGLGHGATQPLESFSRVFSFSKIQDSKIRIKCKLTVGICRQ